MGWPLIASAGVTTPGSSADDYWRPPGVGAPPGETDLAGAPPGEPDPPAESHPAGAPPAEPAPQPTTPPGGYTGPPPTIPPPAGWHPPLHVQPPPPRQLPGQDLTALDRAEQRAQHLTWTVGAVVVVILLALSCAFCVRLVR